MPRACIIVLDAVGAGELPDAAEYGDEGSDTLGNVARAVRGLDLPNLEALGLGNVEPLDGCPPQVGAPAVAGRLVGRVIARRFTGEPGNYERTANRHDFSLEPRRPNYLTLVRDTGAKVHGVGKIGDIFAGQDIDESHPTKSNVDGITQTEKLLRELDDGVIFTNLVETDMLWGHRNDPENFHRCLQDFDRRLPDLLDALRPEDVLIITSDHGCDPTTPSTDHSREHALLVAYVERKNAAGRIHQGEFADVGATVNAWLGGKSPSRGLPGQSIVEH